MASPIQILVTPAPSFSDLCERIVLKPCIRQGHANSQKGVNEYEVISFGDPNFPHKVGDIVLVDSSKCHFYHACANNDLPVCAAPISKQRAWVKIDAVIGKVLDIDRKFTNIIGDKK